MTYLSRDEWIKASDMVDPNDLPLTEEEAKIIIDSNFDGLDIDSTLTKYRKCISAGKPNWNDEE